MPAMKDPPVAKKRKASESRRFNTLVRMDDDLVKEAKKIAALRGVSLGEYFASVLAPIVKRDLDREIRKMSGGSEGKGK